MDHSLGIACGCLIKCPRLAGPKCQRRQIRGCLWLAVGLVCAHLEAKLTPPVNRLLPLFALVGMIPVASAADRVTLWNGRDLTGWTLFLEDKTVAPASVWSARDAVLRFDTKTKGYIRTTRTFSNYHLHVEWRWHRDAVVNSNSGVMVHVHGPHSIWPLSFEAQLKNQNAGQVVGMGLDIPDAPVLAERKRAPRLADPSEKPLGEWNTYEIF